MPRFQPVLPVLLLAVIIVLPCCAFGSSSFLAGTLTKRAHCADIGFLSPRSLKLPFIIGNKKACFSALNPPAATTIIQILPLILSLLWQETSGFSDFLFFHSGLASAFAQWQKKIPPAPAKIFLPLTQDVVMDDDRVSLEKQFRELMENQQQLTEEHKNRSSIYIALINERLRAVVVPGQAISEFLLNSIRHWLLDAELALYLRILPEADWLDLLPELQAIAAAGDDGDPDREPDNDPEPALFIAGESGVQPWLAGLYTESVLQKQKLLSILRQRARQAIASGNYELAKILQNRIMVIGAELSELENAESQVSGNPALQALLLQGLLENADEVRTYAAGNLAVEAPAGKSRSTSNRGATTAKKIPAKKQALSGPDGKPLSSPHNSGSSGDNPGPEQLKHTYNKEPCLACNANICKETEPGPAKDLNNASQGHILALPPEILLYILEYTSLSDRLAMMQCCRHFGGIAADERLMLAWFHEHIPDIQFPIGEAMSAALAAKTGGIFNNAPSLVKQTLARFYALAPSFCTHTLQVEVPDRIWDLATLSDNKIVSALWREPVKVWSINEQGSGFCTHRLQGHVNPVIVVATISDCWVLSGSDEEIKIWDLRRPAGECCTDTLKVRGNAFFTIKTLPDMWFYSFYSDSTDSTIKVWYLTQEGKALLRNTLSVSPVFVRVSCLKVLSQGQLFAGTSSGVINFWENTKADKASLTKAWQAHDKPVVCIEMLPESRLLTHSRLNEIKVWDLKNPEISSVTVFSYRPSFFRFVRCSRVSPDGQVIISSNLPNMDIYTLKNNKLDFVCTQKEDDTEILSIAFFQDGRMVTGSIREKKRDRIIKIWDYYGGLHGK